jgi:hypothetical protein
MNWKIEKIFIMFLSGPKTSLLTRSTSVILQHLILYIITEFNSDNTVNRSAHDSNLINIDSTICGDNNIKSSKLIRLATQDTNKSRPIKVIFYLLTHSIYWINPKKSYYHLNSSWHQFEPLHKINYTKEKTSCLVRLT